MAVYTQITADELNAFLAHFGIGRAMLFEGIKDGVENTNYRIATPQGAFILTIFEKRTREEDLPFCLSFMEHLNAEGIPCPAVVRATAGRSFVHLAGKPAIITSFLEGRWPRQPEMEHVIATGDMLGKMHTAARAFNMTRENPMSLPTWHALVDACGHKIDDIERGLFAVLKRELTWLSQNWPQDLPTGAIHADLFPDNVFFEEDGQLSGVIDFYFSCTDVLVYDLMLTVNAWCFTGGKIDQKRFSALTNAYKKVRHMSVKERASMLFFGRAAAVRILSTRLYDWFHPVEGALVTPKDPLEYWRILKFYQKAMDA